MPDPVRMEQTVHDYVAAFEAASAERAAALYAEGASVEDPVGTARIVGRDAIRAFYEASMSTGARLELLGPVRVIADYAAFSFAVKLRWDGFDRRIDVIDTFRFDEANQIIEMRAFWGPANMHGF